MRKANNTGDKVTINCIRVNDELYMKAGDVVDWLKEQGSIMEGQDIDTMHHLIKALIVGINKIRNNGTNY